MPYQKGTGKSVVVALGGNALGNTPAEQYELVQDTAKHIVDMIAEGINVIVTHGNGPQVGMINNAFAYASANDGKTPEMPFPEAGAMSQGYIGYQLSRAILGEMKSAASCAPPPTWSRRPWSILTTRRSKTQPSPWARS